MNGSSCRSDKSILFITNMIYSFTRVVDIVVVIITIASTNAQAQQFDPYQLNGGLVAAVAGKDYVLIASDTRLTDGGYGIKSRNYLSGRIWSAHSSSTTTVIPSTHPSENKDGDRDNDNRIEEENVDGSGGNDAYSKAITTPFRTTLRLKPTSNLWDLDGSLIVPSSDDVESDASSLYTTILPSIVQKDFKDLDMIKSNRIQSNTLPIMIGSAGCASDCEALKRRMRLELDALLSCTSSSSTNDNHNSRIEVQSVANLLQQILYGRRTFPFYSFCVVAGIDIRRGRAGVGAVYVYDAIGSYERVAVACAGTGRELLQPVLDRLFSSSSSQRQSIPRRRQIHTSILNDVLETETELNRVEEEEVDLRQSQSTIPAEEQRIGTAGSLRPPVVTHVNCPWEEAVQNVAHAYMSVAEREISVGDELVICVVAVAGDNTAPTSSNVVGSSSGQNEVNVFRYPLKKH
jgi:20S proteasome alpha/beta subunit